MSEHTLDLVWNRQSPGFSYEEFNRDHLLIFNERNRVCASAAPAYHGNAECVDPEQAFVASLASCHMLTFLAIASKKGFVVNSYRDHATGVLGRNDQRKPAITNVKLQPSVVFDKEHAPTADQYESLHERAHDTCFISNSIAQCVKVETAPEMSVE
ncbi:MAG: OsmC family peroxiredoxin [Chitinivibrionales bacterium]|nr:OsmC family peroxiredoxin [Chitinivibrionales bacterium]MBD3355651.1 OsmC family peroxiredoxin [Chitinivibrionales bacterium]